MIILMTTTDFLLSILASLISSFLFIFSLLILLRPRVRISNKICLSRTNIEGKQKNSFHIKVVNLSFFPAFDIKVSLEKHTPYPVEGGINFRVEQLKLIKSELSCIAPLRNNKNYGDMAMIFRSEENLTEILEQPQSRISFQITLKHGVTGLTKIYTQTYSLDSSIKEGHFIFGKKIDVV